MSQGKELTGVRGFLKDLREEYDHQYSIVDNNGEGLRPYEFFTRPIAALAVAGDVVAKVSGLYSGHTLDYIAAGCFVAAALPPLRRLGSSIKHTIYKTRTGFWPTK